jgi:hypothetical protein
MILMLLMCQTTRIKFISTHLPLENHQFSMSLNYFQSQAHSARNTFFDKEKLGSEIVRFESING